MERPEAVPTFTALLLATGVFALVGGLAAWGSGPLWRQEATAASLLQWTDVLVTAPLCLLAAWGLHRERPWAHTSVAMTCGVLLFGSVAVYVQVLAEGSPYRLAWILIPLGGLALTAALLAWLRNHP